MNDLPKINACGLKASKVTETWLLDEMFIIKMKFPRYGCEGTTCKRRGKDTLACTSWDKSKNAALVEDKKLHVLIVVVQAIFRRKNDCLVLEISE
jgi:hypothetical protein